MHMTRKLALAALLSSGVGLACGSSTAPTGNGTPGGGHSLVIDANPDIKWKPTPDTISAGDTVRIAWHSLAHNLQFDNTPTAIANIGSGSTGFTSGDSIRVFTVRGTYTYHCGIHGTVMSGAIVVQ